MERRLRAAEREQTERVKAYKARRDAAKADAARKEVEAAAKEGRNLVPTFLKAVQADVTLGEIADTLRGVFGEYRPGIT